MYVIPARVKLKPDSAETCAALFEATSPDLVRDEPDWHGAPARTCLHVPSGAQPSTNFRQALLPSSTGSFASLIKKMTLPRKVRSLKRLWMRFQRDARVSKPAQNNHLRQPRR